MNDIQSLLEQYNQASDPRKKQEIMGKILKLGGSELVALGAPAGSQERIELLVAVNRAHEAVEATSHEMVALSGTRDEQMAEFTEAVGALQGTFGAFTPPAVTDPYAGRGIGLGVAAPTALQNALDVSEQARTTAEEALEEAQNKIGELEESNSILRSQLDRDYEAPEETAPVDRRAVLNQAWNALDRPGEPSWEQFRGALGRLDIEPEYFTEAWEAAKWMRDEFSREIVFPALVYVSMPVPVTTSAPEGEEPSDSLVELDEEEEDEGMPFGPYDSEEYESVKAFKSAERPSWRHPFQRVRFEFDREVNKTVEEIEDRIAAVRIAAEEQQEE